MPNLYRDDRDAVASATNGSWSPSTKRDPALMSGFAAVLTNRRFTFRIGPVTWDSVGSTRSLTFELSVFGNEVGRHLESQLTVLFCAVLCVLDFRLDVGRSSARGTSRDSVRVSEDSRGVLIS